jgi:hypothetical protein
LREKKEEEQNLFLFPLLKNFLINTKNFLLTSLQTKPPPLLQADWKKKNRGYEVYIYNFGPSKKVRL